MTTKNAAVIFTEIPKGYPEVGKHLKYEPSGTIDLEKVVLNGGVLTKTLILSLDPYMRGRMRDPSIKSYSPPFELGKPIAGFFVGKVLRSENEKLKTGDYVYGISPFQEYSVHSKEAAQGFRIITEEERKLIPLTTWVGAAGMPGLTAYHGLHNIGEPKKGDTIFITGASGAVGQIVGQLAKREGLKVIGSAGSDDKIKYLQEIGFDHAWNYKTSKTSDELAKHGPLNIYFDNVGGDQLENALDAAADYARFVECGMISTYNEKPEHGIRNLMYVVTKRIKLQGFIVTDASKEVRDKFYATIPQLISKGELKVKEDITNGLEGAPEALVGIFHGKNNGKAVVKLADE